MGIQHGAAAVLSLLLAHAMGCEDSRFPTCKTNADCAARDAGVAGNVCYNLKCVQCHYDSDCDAGACSASNECEHLVNVKPVPDKPPGEGEKGWDYGNWDQCATDCKDPACIKTCDQKFNKPE